MTGSSIAQTRWRALRVSPKTVWSFVELVDSDGLTGTGEATLGGSEAEMAQALDAWRAMLIGKSPAGFDVAALRSQAASRAQFAVVSALDQALRDLAARQEGVRLVDALGGARRERIAMYANINRGVRERTPEGFAQQARAAVADGFTAVKLAPFDGVALYGKPAAAADRALVDAGLARIAAVREAIGDEVDLRVDCHWRLDRDVAQDVLRATEPLRLYWLECPVPETPGMIDTIRALRGFANARGVRLAGCEEMSLVSGFAPFLEAGCYDVMMPDVKYVGGLDEMLRVADALHAHGVAFSPHNPSGPVCHAASLHVCAAVPHVDRLEMQYAETPLFDALVARGLPRPQGGMVAVPHGAGLGVALDRAVIAQLEAAPA
jgi:galactonate dehydratase